MVIQNVHHDQLPHGHKMENWSSQIFFFLSTTDMLETIIAFIIYFSITILLYQIRDRRTMCPTNIHELFQGLFHHFSCFVIIYQIITLMIIHLLLHFKRGPRWHSG